MSQVIAEITDNGILITADKRITGDSGTFNDNCVKVFNVGNVLVVGIVGKNVLHPQTIRRHLSKNSANLVGSAYNQADTIGKLAADLNDTLGNSIASMRIVVAVFDDTVPMIYEVRVTGTTSYKPKKRNPYFVTTDTIAYDLSEGTLGRQNIPEERDLDVALADHSELMARKSAEDITVSATFNSYFLKADSISKIR